MSIRGVLRNRIVMMQKELVKAREAKDETGMADLLIRISEDRVILRMLKNKL